MGVSALEQTGICYRIFYNAQVQEGFDPVPTYVEFTNVNGFVQRAVSLFPGTVQTVCSLTEPTTGDPTFIEITACGECDGFCTEEDCSGPPPPPPGQPARETAYLIAVRTDPINTADVYIRDNIQGGFTALDVVPNREFTLYVSPVDEDRFVRWTDGGGNEVSRTPTTTLVANKSETYIAQFRPTATTQYTITVNANPSQGGTATILLSGENPSVTKTVAKDVLVTVRATANDGYRFVRWEGYNTFDSAQVDIIVTEDIFLTAIFTPIDVPPPPPSPSPTPVPVIEWRLCSTGQMQTGNPPADYREVPYLGEGGGTCWEPVTDIGFNPSLNNLVFNYQRGSSQYPTQKTIAATNSSYSLPYTLSFDTNFTHFNIEPRQLVIPPRETRTFTVSIINTELNTLGDGQSVFQLNVNVTNGRQ